MGSSVPTTRALRGLPSGTSPTAALRGGSLSSAILYVAIVVIWAAVLIPRWLRRDPVVPVSAGEAELAAEMNTLAEKQPSPLRTPSMAPPVPLRWREEPARERRPRLEDGRDQRDEDRPGRDVDRDVRDEGAHRKVVSARRRLMLMLVGLALGAAVLAGAKLAAWWVIVPPSVMLLGYVLMLRTAAKVDAERRAAPPIRRPEPVRAPVRPATAATGALAGAKIINISVAPEPVEDSIYDQYADAKLRAVGD
jgi:hypothetical protein